MLYLILSLTVAAWIFIGYLARQNKQYILKAEPVEAVGPDYPLVSIIVPARNEETALARCLASLASLDYPAYEVIVVDDHSTDQTHAVAELFSDDYANFRVVRSRELPAGWTGKNWANHQGAQAAKGEWLLFIDADAELYPDALTASLGYVRGEGVDMLSLLPHAEMVNFWDKITLPIMGGLIMAASPLTKVNSPDSAMAMAVGAFILISRRVYTKAGGHAAVRGEIVDDRELARLVKSAGFRLRVLDGTKICQVQMYESFGDLWEGWSKNLFLGMDADYVKAVITIGAIFFLYVFPALVLAGWLSGVLGPPQAGLGLGGMILLTNLSISCINIRIQRVLDMKFPTAYGLCWPLGGAVVIGIIGNSILRYHQGISWKGRTYNT
jgi:chlorobactene glucosyltransferase